MAVEYKPYNNFIEYLDYIDIDISDTSRLYLILAKIFGKLSHANLRFVIFDKLNISVGATSARNRDYSEELISELPKYAFRINNNYYSPYLMTSTGLKPVSFYSPKLKNINYTYMKAVYRDLIKFFEFFSTSEEFIYYGTFKFEYSLDNNNDNMIFKRQSIKFNHSPISITKRTFDELVQEFIGLTFIYDDDGSNDIYTYEDVKNDLLETEEKKKKEKEQYLKDDEFSINNYDGSLIEIYVMSKC